MYRIKFLETVDFKINGAKLRGLAGSFMRVDELKKVQQLIDDKKAVLVEVPKTTTKPNKKQTTKN